MGENDYAEQNSAGVKELELLQYAGQLVKVWKGLLHLQEPSTYKSLIVKDPNCRLSFFFLNDFRAVSLYILYVWIDGKMLNLHVGSYLGLVGDL